MPTGLYVSVPFCRSKCTYCNFTSDVFSRAVFDRYLERVSSDLHTTLETARRMGGQLDPNSDSVYLGGGTPTLLEPNQLARLLFTIRQNFRLLPGTEITVECAPGTLRPAMLETLVASGVNRVSLGVQSFEDREAAAVGRLHKAVTVHDDLARLHAAGITNLNIDLIAGLPHQTSESWDRSLAATIALGVPHVSVYMLEVDGESRLGRELIAGGTRYHAHFVPDDDLTVDLYLRAVERLEAAGIRQYEISNFARGAAESRHNLKYWTRQPYLGFGVDAHSMLPSTEDGIDAVRFSTADSLEEFVAGAPFKRTAISRQGALEESFFLGLRLNRGVDLEQLVGKFGAGWVELFRETILACVRTGLVESDTHIIRLTPRGRLFANEVFERFLRSASDLGSPAGATAAPEAEV